MFLLHNLSTLYEYHGSFYMLWAFCLYKDFGNGRRSTFADPQLSAREPLNTSTS